MPEGLFSGLAGLLDIVRQSGPAGAIIASAIVGLTLAVIVVARLKSLWDGVKERSQSVDFQAKLLAIIETTRASEESLRRRVDELGRERGSQQERIDDMNVQIALLRHQRRRLIDMLRHAVASLPEPAVRAR